MRLKWWWALLAAVVYADIQKDPYSVLGVSRTSSTSEIKKTYKKLALEWHPDRNDSPYAGERFMEINRAYEILSDPEKKLRYDNYGAVDDQMNNFQRPQHFDEFFSFPFGRHHGGSNIFEKHRLTIRMYMHSVLERSYTQPFLIFAYSSYCGSCFAMEPQWTEAVSDLEGLGYGIGTINYMFDGNMFEKLRVSRVPSLIVLVEGRAIHYRGNYNQLSARQIRLFARDAIPNTFMTRINTYSALKRFLDLWESTNKASVLFAGNTKEPRLRYLLSAMKYSHFMRFAYIHLKDPSADLGAMKKALGIQCGECENVLVFRDDPLTGASDRLSTTSHQLSNVQLDQFLEENKFLMLPRISSMQFFDELCPVSSRSQRHFCIILPIKDISTEGHFVSGLRQFVAIHKELLGRLRIHISYIYISAQSDFMGQFAKHLSWEEDATKRDLLVLWRNEYVKAKYSWVSMVWPSDAKPQREAFTELLKHIQLMSQGAFKTDETAQIPTLVNEFAPSLFTTFSRQIVRMVMTLWFHATKEEILPIVSIVGTLLFIFFVGYFLNYFLGEHRAPGFEKPPPYTESKDWHPDDPKTGDHSDRVAAARKRVWKEMEPMMHELRAETYFGLIRLLKPGCRSIIVIVDEESKSILLPQFARYIYPLRKNKTFSFGFLMINKNLAWFREMLKQLFPDESNDPTTSAANVGNNMSKRLKDINPKQTLGTVLVLCGYKLYFCIYHPMHPSRRPDDTDESSDETKQKAVKSKAIKVENVLNGFPNFLDRLLEGSVRRYYVPEWPDNLK